MKSILLGVLLFAAAGMAMQAQVGDALIGTTAPKKQGISDEVLFRTVIKELSADQFGGRKPLSPYEGPVLDYISGKFKEVGLEPAAGGSYLQKVPLLSVKTHLKNNQLSLKGSKGKTTLAYWDETVVWSLRAEKNFKFTNAEFVFAGFGIQAPEFGWNDYEGLDAKGKVVVVMVNDPGYYDDNLFKGKYMTYYGRWSYKFEEAGRQGAAAVLIIHDTAPASYDWSVIQNGRSDGVLCLLSDNGNKELVPLQGWVTGDAAKKIFNAAGIPFDESLAAAKKKGFKSIPLGLKSTFEFTNDVIVGESANVAGILPGTSLKDEYIVYTAHWDHLGIGRPVDGDSIYNGADDNASGVAGLVLLAKRFKELPERPKRSILFLSVTGEESGLLGSEYYAKHPLFPLNKTVVNLNMDIYGDKMRTHDVVVNAAGDSETDRYVIETAASQGREVIPSTGNTVGGYFRSDHFNFAKVGVPVVLAKGGDDYLDPEAAKAHSAYYNGKSTYHQPSDEYRDWWDVSGSLDDIYLFYGIGLRLANDGYFPKWNESSPYKLIREGKK
jgi:Zn-dependent M28 family amino/carboxypeptidase